MLFLYLWISVQIIAEMLPISSSGHITLLERIYSALFGLAMPDAFGDVPIKALYYLMHGPTLVLLTIYFFFFSRKPVFLWGWKKFWHYTCMIFVADCITVLCYGIITYYSLSIPLPLGFFISILILFSLRVAPVGVREEFTIRDALILGLVQGIALLPGISRLAATYSAGRWLRMNSLHAFELAWFIQVPLILAAFAKSLMVIANTGAWRDLLNLPLALVIVSASGIAWCVFIAMTHIVQKNRVDLFAWYVLLPLALSLLM
jgi:undecaprenyl-diphosphatase